MARLALALAFVRPPARLLGPLCPSVPHRCQPAWNLDPRSVPNIDPAMSSLMMGLRNVGMCVAEHRRSFTEREVGGDHDRGLLVKAADEVEQQLTARQRERQIAEFVEDHEIERHCQDFRVWAGG